MKNRRKKEKNKGERDWEEGREESTLFILISLGSGKREQALIFLHIENFCVPDWRYYSALIVHKETFNGRVRKEWLETVAEERALIYVYKISLYGRVNEHTYRRLRLILLSLVRLFQVRLISNQVFLSIFLLLTWHARVLRHRCHHRNQRNVTCLPVCLFTRPALNLSSPPSISQSTCI